jgi:outer membrane protein assembly factor BamA
VDYLWYGIGNNTPSDPAPAPPGAASANEYISESVRLRSLVRVQTGTPVDFAAATNLRYEFPTIYPGSQIASDIADGYVRGQRPAFLETVSEGFIVDTRDNEFTPHHGVYYQVGVGETIGTAESVSFGEVSAVLSHYVPLGQHVVFANRLIGSLKWGTIPFYELQTAGAFDPFILVGGERGLRGIPSGRFAGPFKVMTNNEVRVTAIPRFRVWRWSLNIGMEAFFDAGRVFSEFAYREGNDGTGLGMKCSTGGGFFFQWDESSVFRVDLAYSPSGAGGPPVFYYVANGLLF